MDEPVETILGVATEEQLKFAHLVVECGEIKAACIKMWPDVSQCERKGHRWLEIPVVRAAVAAIGAAKAAENLTQVRAWFEMCGLGLQERVKIVSEMVHDPKTTKTLRLELLRYIDDLEAGAKKAKDDGGGVGLLERMVLSMAATSQKRELPAPVDATVVEEGDCQGESRPEVQN